MLKTTALVVLLLAAAGGEEDPCKSCKVPSIPLYNQGAMPDWTPFAGGAPIVSVEFINPKRGNGECQMPADCEKTECRWWGTLQINNDNTIAPLQNAQISVNGALVSASGALAPGASRAKEYTEDNPLGIECIASDKEIDVEFSVTGPTGGVFTSVLKLKCPGCTP